MENFLDTQNINLLLVFLEGVLSFLSPCILPLIPIYISYLAGNGKEINEKGEVIYKRKIVLINTILFVIGISFAFFLLGMTFSALGTFFRDNKVLFSRISGIIIIALGIMQLGIFKIKFFEKEHKFNAKLNLKKMNPLLAFVMGFTFSFAWTPCVGPILASVLALASSSTNAIMGNLYVVVYTIGFIIPFILLGLFTTKVLNFLKSKPKILNYTIKISAIILIIIGVLVLGSTIKIDFSKSEIRGQGTKQDISEGSDSNKEDESIKQEKIQAFDFELQDQYGKTHKLSDYKGKVVFLNFWATWCPPCTSEMPYIEELYKEYGKNENEVIILGVANPRSEKNQYAADVPVEDVKEFLKEDNYTFPVVMDFEGKVLSDYYINSFPTTFMINKNGDIEGYAVGAMTKNKMKQIIEQTKGD